MGVELTTKVAIDDVDAGAVPEAVNLDVGGGLDQVRSSDGAVGDDTGRALALLHYWFSGRAELDLNATRVLRLKRVQDTARSGPPVAPPSAPLPQSWVCAIETAAHATSHQSN